MNQGAEIILPINMGVPGPIGPASTVPGPTGPASTVPGPKGEQGTAGTANTVTWTATTFTSGSQVNYLGKDWVSNAATLSTDIPGNSSKWVEKLSGYSSLITSGRVATLLNGKSQFSVDMVANTYKVGTNSAVLVSIGKDIFSIAVQPIVNFTFAYNSVIYYKKSTNEILVGLPSDLNNLDNFIVSIWVNTLNDKKWIYNSENMILKLADANVNWDVSKTLRLSSNTHATKFIIDQINETITIPSYSDWLYSDTLLLGRLLAPQMLSYSAVFNDKMVYLYYNATTSQMVIGNNVTQPSNTNDKLYFVTSFKKNTGNGKANLSLNPTGFIIISKTDEEIIEITALGDSNTFGGGWTTGIQEVLNQKIILNNLGVNSSKVLNDSSSSMSVRCATIPASTKLLIIAGGTNDTASTVGNLQAVGPYNDATFIGAYQKIIETAYSINSSMRILIIIPSRSYTAGVVQVDRSHILAAIKQVAKKYAIPFVDLHDQMGVNEQNQSIYLTDMLHYTAVGKNVLKRMISSAIKSYY